MNSSIEGLLGLAYRGRNLMIGDDAIKQLSTGRVVLMLIADDASENTKKRCQDKCLFYHIECLDYGAKYDIGACLGKTAVSCLGILNVNLAKKIKLLMKVGEEND